MTLKEIAKNSSTTIVDVRTSEEYATGHFQNAINVPMDAIASNLEKIKNLNAGPIIFYCRSGNRSGQVVKYLAQLGFRNVYNGGGIGDMEYLVK